MHTEQSDGLKVPGDSDMVCRLKKTLYGLMQTSRAWNERMDRYLLQHNVRKCTTKINLYLKVEGDKIIDYFCVC